MNGNTPALLLAAAGVGFGHAILPDHWVPLAMLGRAQRYPLSRVARLSSLAGAAHVLVSVLLGAIIVAVGLQFRSSVQSAQDAIVGGVLIATGVGFLGLDYSGRGHHHDHAACHDHEHDAGHDPDHHHHDDAHEHDNGHQDGHGHSGRERGMRGLASVMVPFGAAASPDLTILPVFLAATTAGVATALVSLAVFSAVTIATIVGLTVSAARGAYEIQGEWLERWGNAITAVVLLAIGVLVVTGVV